jgi:hypothetical protein
MRNIIYLLVILFCTNKGIGQHANEAIYAKQLQQISQDFDESNLKDKNIIIEGFINNYCRYALHNSEETLNLYKKFLNTDQLDDILFKRLLVQNYDCHSRKTYFLLDSIVEAKVDYNTVYLTATLIKLYKPQKFLTQVRDKIDTLFLKQFQELRSDSLRLFQKKKKFIPITQAINLGDQKLYNEMLISLNHVLTLILNNQNSRFQNNGLREFNSIVDVSIAGVYTKNSIDDGLKMLKRIVERFPDHPKVEKSFYLTLIEPKLHRKTKTSIKYTEDKSILETINLLKKEKRFELVAAIN